jgi:rfaE bifunctional protein kinase chain/domain
MTSLENIINNAHKLKIAVIGDFIEDRYIIGDVDRISPEAPVPVVKVTEKRMTWGGAGNVYMNLKGMGVEAHLFCDMYEKMIPIAWNVHREERPHCVKTRVMSNNHHIVRFDNEVVPLWRNVEGMSWWKDFTDQITAWDAVVISDYHKGVVSDDIAEYVINLCEQYKVPVIVDAKRDFLRFENATILKCNAKEWAHSEKDEPNHFRSRNNIETIVITYGQEGIQAGDSTMLISVEGHKVPIADTCGAGDTVTAVLAVCKALGIEIVMAAAPLANRLAAEVCRHPGVYAITKEDLIRINAEVRESSI